MTDESGTAVDRLRTMNECVRVYVDMRHRGVPARAGWLEEEVAATDAFLNRRVMAGAIREHPPMNTNQWIAHVDQARRGDDLLARGAWHGYTGDNSGPMKGAFYLVRWAAPTVAVSHDDPAEALRLARLIEETVGAP